MTRDRKLAYAKRLISATSGHPPECRVCAEGLGRVMPVLEEALREMAEDVSADYARMSGVRLNSSWPACACSARDARVCWASRHHESREENDRAMACPCTCHLPPR